MKDFKNDSTSAVSRFGRDKRERTSTASAERVERRPHSQRDAADSGHSFEHRPERRASYNPNFTPDNRPVGGERPRRENDSKPYGDRRFGDKPAYGNRDNDGDRRSFGEKKSYGDRSSGPKKYGDKPSFGDRKPYGDKPAYGERREGSRSYGDKPSFGDRKPYGDKPSFGDRKPYGDKPAYGERREGSRSYGDKPSFGDRKPYGDKPSFGDRKPYGDKPSFGDRKPYGDKPGFKKFGDKPAYGSRGNDGERRSFGDRKPYGDKPSFGDRKPYGDKPGFKKFGPKPAFRREFDADGKPVNYPKYDPNKQTGEVRLNRFIAQSGVCSRREADDFIQAGLVSVNGTIITELGTKVMPTDEVKFNDSRVQGEKKVYLVLNKPKGFVTSLEDPHADKTVMDLVRDACTERIYPVGRLDKNSVGLLLFTNDGDLTKQLTHPSYKKKKIYQVTLDKALERADMDAIAKGVTLEDGEIYADEVAYVKDNKKEIGVEIHSGRNRIVRRIFEHLGYTVAKLDRVYYAGLTKKNLKRGDWRFLSREEVERLKSGQYE